MTLAVRQDPKEGLVVLDGKEKCSFRNLIYVESILTLLRPQADRPTADRAASCFARGRPTSVSFAKTGICFKTLTWDRQFLQNPYYWAMTTLIDADTHELVTSEDRRPVLLGATTSSLHRLKDIDNKGESSDFGVSY